MGNGAAGASPRFVLSTALPCVLPRHERNGEAMHEQILALRGIKSYGLIAAEFGLTRNQVAGIMFRAKWPPEKRVPSPRGLTGNKIGHGYRRGPWARHTLHGGE